MMGGRGRVFGGRRGPRQAERATADGSGGRAAGDAPSRELPEDLLSLYFAELRRVPLLSAEEETRLAQQIEAGQEAEARLITEADGLDEATRVGLHHEAAQGREAFERFVSANLRLVVAEATKFARRSHLDLDELIQEGNLGLIRAVEKFDWRRELKFSTYATWWIRKALQRGTADKERTIRLPAGVHANLLKVRASRSRLHAELGRAPRLDELSAASSLTETQVRDALAADFALLSLDKPVSEGDDAVDMGALVARAADSPDEEVTDRLFIDGVLETGRRELSERSWKVLCLRYGLEGQEPMTLVALGEELGVSRETVRTLEQQALSRLRRAIQRPPRSGIDIGGPSPTPRRNGARRPAAGDLVGRPS